MNRTVPSCSTLSCICKELCDKAVSFHRKTLGLLIIWCPLKQSNLKECSKYGTVLEITIKRYVTATEMYGDCVTILIVRIVYGFFCAYDVRTTIFSPN